MRNIKRQLIAACVIASFGASVAIACIPEFGWQLLDNRAATLDKMPVAERSFAWSEAHLFPSPNDKLAAEETDYPDEARNDDIAQAVAHAEVAGLASDQANVVTEMRAEATGDGAFNKGAMLPTAVRLYTAGAVEFHKGNSAKAICTIPGDPRSACDERRDREVWAAYMLGRLYGGKGEIGKASKSFALTREFVNKVRPTRWGWESRASARKRGFISSARRPCKGQEDVANSCENTGMKSPPRSDSMPSRPLMARPSASTHCGRWLTRCAMTMRQ